MDEIKKIYSMVLRGDKKAMREYVKAEKRVEKKKARQIMAAYSGINKFFDAVKHKNSLVKVGNKYYHPKDVEKAIRYYNQNVK